MRRMAVGAVMAVLAVAVGSSAFAGPAPRHADLTGLWSAASLTELERPDDFKTLVASAAEAAKYELAHRNKLPDLGDKENPVGGAESEWWELDFGLARVRGQARTSWIVAPADGKRPFTAAAKAWRKTRRADRLRPPDDIETRDLDERCISSGATAPLAAGGSNDNYQFVQAGDRLAIHAEWMGDVRVVRIGDTAHPPPSVRVSGGDSIGRWEGDTLVVETTNFPPAEVEAPNGDTAADMRIVERFTRTSPTEVLYSFRVTNPAVYSQTWQAETVLHPGVGRIFEYACHEGNYALGNILAAARRMEGRKVDDIAVGR